MVEEQCTQFDTSECCPKLEIKFACNEKYTAITVIGGIAYTATKTGYGTGDTKEEACETALLNAQTLAEELLALKTAGLS